jgi:hypothetical protein
MSKWLVRLKGEQFDLEDFPKLFCLPEVRIIEENGTFYLESSEFKILTKAEDVRERGRAIIKLINGVAKFNRSDFQGISDDVIILEKDDGKRKNYIFLEGKALIRTKVWGKLTVLHYDNLKKVKIQTSISNYESLFKKVQKYKVVTDALNFYKDDTWISFFKVYEIIGDDLNGKHKIIENNWATNSKVSRFTQTAQSRAVLGDSARHASKKYIPPIKPMTIVEARILIKSILSRWISSKT